jgi:hypothetical protein
MKHHDPSLYHSEPGDFSPEPFGLILPHPAGRYNSFSRFSTEAGFFAKITMNQTLLHNTESKNLTFYVLFPGKTNDIIGLSENASTRNRSKRTEKAMDHDKYLLSSVTNSIRILDLLGEEELLGVAEISAKLKMNKTSVFRYLYTLESGGYVRKTSEAKYTLGDKFFDMVNIMMQRRKV